MEEKANIGRSSKTPDEEEIDEKNVEIKQEEKLKTDQNVINVIERPDAVSL